MYPAITICGMRRSGNHAVIGWMLKGTDWYHINNVSSNMAIRRVNVKTYKADGEFVRHLDYTPTDLSKVLQSQEERPVMYEDAWVLVRSVYNVFASRLARLQAGWPPDKYAMALWCEHAESPNRKILFDKWLVSPSYRFTLSQQVGLGSQAEHNYITRDGGGSSFTRIQPLNKAQLLRRCDLIKVPDFLLECERARRLNLQHFGWALNRKGQRIGPDYELITKNSGATADSSGKHPQPGHEGDEGEGQGTQQGTASS